MNLGILATIAYGLLAFVGGVIGYQTAKSKVSLISGTSSGLLLILSGILALNGIKSGFTLGAVISGVLVIVFGIRCFKTRKFMPAGLMLLVGILTLGIIGVQFSSI